jgi:hypothetical protein
LTFKKYIIVIYKPSTLFYLTKYSDEDLGLIKMPIALSKMEDGNE